MIGYLYRLIIGRFSSCEHKWRSDKEGQITPDGKWIMFTQRCDNCGEIQTRKVK